MSTLAPGRGPDTINTDLSPVHVFLPSDRDSIVKYYNSPHGRIYKFYVEYYLQSQ